MRILLKSLAGALLALACAILLYLAAAWVAARIPVNPTWRPATAGIPVYLRSNGVHIDLVLPLSAGCACDRHHAPLIDVLDRPFDAAVPRGQWQWVAVGWGSEPFMLYVPDWEALTPGIALRAVTGLDGSVLRLSSTREPVVGGDTRRLLLSAEQYRRLLAYLRASAGASPQERHSPIAGPEDRFYRATDHYHLFLTCNEWVGRGLARAGVRVPLWTPFDDALLEAAGQP